MAMVIGGALSAMPAHAFDRISIASFNVGNVFDTIDDPDHFGDNTYLPLSVKQARPEHDAQCNENIPFESFARLCRNLDWSEEVLAAKLSNIADVIASMPEKPAILVLQETENREIVERLNSEFLGESRFEHVIHLDSTDEILDRGIDVAILTDLPGVGSPQALRVNFGDRQEECRATRDIVKAPLMLPDGAPLVVYGVHFPSGSNPFYCRRIAMMTVNDDLRSDAENGNNTGLAVMAGDINFPCHETAGDFFERLVLDGNWWVPPEVTSGCSQPGSSKFAQRGLDRAWFTWSFLDAILVSNSLVDGRTDANWFADLGSFRTIIATEQQLAVSDAGFVEPREFEPTEGTGVSDHFPVVIDLVSRGSR